MANRRATGFTIVELLIVVVVIAVLAAIVIVSYNGIRQRSIETAIKTDLSGNLKKLETQKTLTGTDSYSSVISQFLNVSGSQSSVKYKYGDKTSYCLEASSTSQPGTIYSLSFNKGTSDVQLGACPAPASNATVQCISGNAYVSVYQSNDTSGDVIMNNTSIYGENTSTVRTPGQAYSVATNSRLSSIPAGFTTTYITGTNGFTYSAERYHAYEARTC